MAEARAKTADILKSDMTGLLSDWMAELRATGADQRITDAELKAQTHQFLTLIAEAAAQNTDVTSEGWRPVRDFLEGVSRSRALQGFSSSETATFVFSLKKPLFTRIRRMTANDAQGLADETWTISEMIDSL